MPFPESHQSIISEWAGSISTDREWKPVSGQGFPKGESKGRVVQSEGFELRAYLKPVRKKNDGVPRAANEKIAADLAHVLSLPVPPVLLYHREGCPSDEEEFACLSLVMYPKQWEWKHFKQLGEEHTEALMTSHLARASGMIGFDTYVANQDRNNDNNAIFGYDPESISESSFVFLDYSFSMNKDGAWENDGWQVVKPVSSYPLQKQGIDRTILEESVYRIESLPERKIIEIVERIPEGFISADEKAVVLDGLIGRRELVRDALAAASLLKTEAQNA